MVLALAIHSAYCIKRFSLLTAMMSNKLLGLGLGLGHGRRCQMQSWGRGGRVPWAALCRLLERYHCERWAWLSLSNGGVGVHYGITSTGTPLMVASNATGVWRNRDFRPISRFISEMVQVRAAVTNMKGEYETVPKLPKCAISHDLELPMT